MESPDKKAPEVKKVPKASLVRPAKEAEKVIEAKKGIRGFQA